MVIEGIRREKKHEAHYVNTFKNARDCLEACKRKNRKAAIFKIKKKKK